MPIHIYVLLILGNGVEGGEQWDDHNNEWTGMEMVTERQRDIQTDRQTG